MAYVTAIICAMFFATLLFYGIFRKERDLLSFVIVVFSFSFLIVCISKAQKSAELIDNHDAINKNVKDIISQFR